MLTYKTLRDVQNKKELNQLLGKHSDVSVEKYVMRIIRENKKLKLQQKDKNKKNGISNQDKNMLTRLKKEPEKNKTHWDVLLSEMKWMQADFEKERRQKKKTALNLVKFVKKAIETKQVEMVKNIKKQEANLQKKYMLISRNVKNYWQKIEKITKYNYNTQLNGEKIVQQQIRLMTFINKLGKISSKVASSLGPGMNKKIAEQSSSLSFCSDVMSTNTNANIISSSNNVIENEQESNGDDINITLQKLSNGTYSLLDVTLPENDIANAAKCAEQIQPKGTRLAEANISLKQPFLLHNVLREYQLIGLHWLLALHDNRINGILADEMGLGKTIQTIALFAELASNRCNWGPHLIIVPTTIIVNWEIEFKKWCPSFKILSYYGNQKERKAKRYGWLKPNSFHICITSYKLVIQDYSIFKRKRWYYIVLDEAQNIKNFKSKRWQMLLNFRAKRKLLLTGTPLQNDIMEIWSYLHFLMPNLFYSNEEFREWFHTQFYNAIHNNAALNKQIIQSLHSILRPFLLRRLKKDVEKQLPEKIEHVVYCELSRRQKYLYDEYINTDITQDTLKRNDYFSIMNVLMQLRKVCNHPDLFDSRDYNTSMKSCFDIVFVFPSLCCNVFEYNPLRSINYKNLHLIILDNEHFNTWDYANMLKYFPSVPLFEVYDDIYNNTTQFYQPKYLIDENDILFKKNYADNTLLYESNSRNIKDNVIQMLINLNPNSSNANAVNNENTKTQQQTDKEQNNDYKTAHNLYVPNYICPTNIPILQNNSLNNYYDMFYELDTSKQNGEAYQPYLKSVFSEEISKMNLIMHRNKQKILHGYDMNSRLDIVSSKPLFGFNGLKVMKLSLFMDSVNSPLVRNHIMFCKRKKGNVVMSSILNRGYRYVDMGYNIQRESDCVKVYEGYDEEEKEWEEQVEKVKKEYEKKKEEKANNSNVNTTPNVDQDINNENTKQNEQQQQQPTTNNDNNAVNEEEELILPTKPSKPIPHISLIDDTFPTHPSSSLTSSDTIYHIHSKHLQNLMFSPQKYLSLCDEIMTYFRIYIPKVISAGPRFIPSKINTSLSIQKNKYKTLYNNLHRINNVVKYLSLFKTISCPDRKLVEYDSGKLIKLSGLLKSLYQNKSKALIFTQMTRMLDILEIFLNIHGFTYVRLDGSTKVELRQQIVDKFNTDPKVFCFISSTRSGGIGLNLTGADSIIFFDTDWNPAMDKQAQDRCHRIGQTRTVNIYRLITLSTIEENIFKKSIQKRELNYVVMEDGKFNTENVTKLNLKNIIQEENLIKKGDDGDNEGSEVRNKKEDKIKQLLEFENLRFTNEEDQKNIEQMLIKIEDQEDVQAMKNLSKEMLDEYEKENNELQFLKEDDKVDNNKDIKEKEILDKLKPIDKFALNYYKDEYTYKTFVKEKEAKMNLNYTLLPDSGSEGELNEDESIDLGNESESEQDLINKMDVDRAYDLYLKKKNEIMKMFEQIEVEEQEKEEQQNSTI